MLQDQATLGSSPQGSLYYTNTCWQQLDMQWKPEGLNVKWNQFLLPNEPPLKLKPKLLHCNFKIKKNGRKMQSANLRLLVTKIF